MLRRRLGSAAKSEGKAIDQMPHTIRLMAKPPPSGLSRMPGFRPLPKPRHWRHIPARRR